MRVQRSIIAILSVSLLAACGRDIKGKLTGGDTPPLAFVRYFNAVGDTLGTDFRAIDQVTFSTPFLAVPYRGQGLGGYMGYEAGTRRIRVFPDSRDLVTTSSWLVDTTLTLDAGRYYTIIHTGYARPGSAPKQGLWVLTDTFPTVSGTIAYRVMNVGPDLGNVDVYATATAAEALPATPTFANVGLKGVSTYVQRAPGTLVFRAFAAGTTTPALVTATAQAGTAGTTSADPVGGASVAGSVITAMVYSRSVAGSAAQNFTTPGIVYWIDRQPPRTTP